MNQNQNLLGMDWIELFNLLDKPINSFCDTELALILTS